MYTNKANTNYLMKPWTVPYLLSCPTTIKHWQITR